QIVAQILEMPTQIELNRRPLIWSGALAEYIGWVDEFYFRPVAVLRVIEPADYAGLTQKVISDALPEHIRTKVPLEGPPRRFSDKLHKERQPIKIEILISDMPPGTGGIHDPEPQLQKVDGWQIRDDFIRLKLSTASLLEF